MNLVHVIPLSRGIFKEELTYFTSHPVSPGAIVTVPVRSKKINALVVSSEDAGSAKAALKASPYAIKKIDAFKSKDFFLPQFIEAARETASYFVATPGDVIQAFTPKDVLGNSDKIKGVEVEEKKEEDKGRILLKQEKFVLQMPDEERMSVYKSLIREEFARHASVFFCLPTIQDIETVVGSLERGISDYTFALHSGLSKKELLATWNKIAAEKHPVLIVATATFFSVPRRDIKTIILDRENSRNYKAFSRPFVDTRTFAEFFAERTGARLIFGDILLRPETLWRKDEGEFQELAPLKFRSISTAEQNIVDMRNYKKDTLHGSWSMLSDDLKELVTRTMSEHSNLFILVGRRGLSPVTVCSDCGAIHTCARCSSPLVLHKNKDRGGNHYLCHKCGTISSAEVRCKVCDSWRLAPLGVGIEKVEEEISAHAKNAKVFRIDSDMTKTPKKARGVYEEWTKTPGGILIGTGMALAYLDHSINNSAVVGIDALFTIPDFRINEKIMGLLLGLREKTRKQFLIQTRNAGAKIFEHLTRGNLLDFYRDEIEDRKMFGYPPFQHLIKITWSGKKAVAGDEMKKLSMLLEGYEHISFPAFIQEMKGQYRMNVLIKMERGAWIDEKLSHVLKSLPPNFTVRIDPEDIL